MNIYKLVKAEKKLSNSRKDKVKIMLKKKSKYFGCC